MKTYAPKAKEITRAWYVVDADGQVLGRLASEVARILSGKHKPTWAPYLDMGDHVIVVNASKIRVTGQKADSKIYYNHSQYPGGLREVPLERMLRERPERVIERAVRGMLPSTRLGRAMLKKLNVYAGPEHPHEAQQPSALRVGQNPASREEG